MAKVYFVPNAVAVAQESRATPATPTVTDVNKLLVNGIAIATYTTAVATVADITAGLTAAWNASTHSYKTGITASDQITYVKLLGPAGMPFTVTASVTGTGTLVMSTPTAGTGPNDWANVDNWSGGAVPVDTNEVIIADTSVPICWGLAQSAVTLTSLTIYQTYTGKIGLDWQHNATNGDGSTVGTSEEYRQDALQIKVNGLVEIGKPKGFGAAAGSGRIVLDLSTQAATVVVHNTATAESETGRNCVRLIANSASTNVIVRSAPGGLGIATERPDQTATIGTITIGDVNVTGFTSLPSRSARIDGAVTMYSQAGESTTQSRVVISQGVTLTNYYQEGGDNVLSAAATVAIVEAYAGRLTLDGDFTITTLVNGRGGRGATILANHVKTGGNCVTTALLLAGLTDARRVGRAQAWGTVVAAGRDKFAMNPIYTTIGISQMAESSGESGGGSKATPQQ